MANIYSSINALTIIQVKQFIDTRVKQEADAKLQFLLSSLRYFTERVLTPDILFDLFHMYRLILYELLFIRQYNM